jgi:hypothetical protein
MVFTGASPLELPLLKHWQLSDRFLQQNEAFFSRGQTLRRSPAQIKVKTCFREICNLDRQPCFLESSLRQE